MIDRILAGLVLCALVYVAVRVVVAYVGLPEGQREAILGGQDD